LFSVVAVIPREKLKVTANAEKLKIVDWYMEGKIRIDDLITHQMPIEKINDAFDLMHKGESIRSVALF